MLKSSRKKAHSLVTKIRLRQVELHEPIGLLQQLAYSELDSFVIKSRFQFVD